MYSLSGIQLNEYTWTLAFYSLRYYAFSLFNYFLLTDSVGRKQIIGDRIWIWLA